MKQKVAFKLRMSSVLLPVVTVYHFALALLRGICTIWDELLPQF